MRTGVPADGVLNISGLRGERSVHGGNSDALTWQQALEQFGHEQLTICRDPSAGYVGIIAVHSTALGPAVGGTRLWHYPSLGRALIDALRLSRGMTYKNALAGLPFGGGKSVLLAPGQPLDGPPREALFRAHARFVDRMKGLYITAEDVGTTPADMELMARETPHVAGLLRGVGDPSPFTARGVCRAMQAAAHTLWGRDTLEGRTVAIQGLGSVGSHLATDLAARGAQLLVTDVDPARVERVVAALGAVAIEPMDIFDVPVDIFAPCALGGVLDDETIPRLRVQAVVGAANNQLLEARHGDALASRQILYVPDYVANAGGVISGSVDIAGWDRARMHEQLDRIYDTVLEVCSRAREWETTPVRAADRLAEERIARK